jgi:hypothetical protein
MSSNTDKEWEILNNPIEEGYTLVNTNLSKQSDNVNIILPIILKLLKNNDDSLFKICNEELQKSILSVSLCVIEQNNNLKFSDIPLIKEYLENKYNDYIAKRNSHELNLFYVINSSLPKSYGSKPLFLKGSLL